jgi:hypothetical protein
MSGRKTVGEHSAPAQPYLLCDVAWVTNGLGGVGSSADEALQAGTIRGRAWAYAPMPATRLAGAPAAACHGAPRPLP